MHSATIATPRLLDRDDIAARGSGWYLPRSGSHWASVAEHPPGPAAGTRCWWVPEKPPGGGWWRPVRR